MNIIFLIIIIVLVLFFIIALTGGGESAAKRAGDRGEAAASDFIESVLRDGDVHLRNVKLMFEGKPAECDNIIINTQGVFIIEVKAIKGRIFGYEDDYNWTQEKVDQWGIAHTKVMNNTVHQVKRQTHFLAKTLKKSGINVWVDGYIIFMYANAPYSDPMFIRTAGDLDAAIHGGSRRQLAQYEVDKAAKLLAQK